MADTLTRPRPSVCSCGLTRIKHPGGGPSGQPGCSGFHTVAPEPRRLTPLERGDQLDADLIDDLTAPARMVELGPLRGLPDRVDAGPVRAHVRALMDAGIGYPTIAEVADVPLGTMRTLLYPRRNPIQHTREDVARRLLAVTADSVPAARKRGFRARPAGTGWTDTEPVRQHIRDLMGQGLERAQVAALAGVKPSLIRDLLHQQRCQAATVRADIAAAILAVTVEGVCRG